MLLRNMNQTHGLNNGSRLIISQIGLRTIAIMASYELSNITTVTMADNTMKITDTSNFTTASTSDTTTDITDGNTTTDTTTAEITTVDTMKHGCATLKNFKFLDQMDGGYFNKLEWQATECQLPQS